MNYEELIESIDFLAVSRAYRILRLYSGVKEKSAGLAARFESWLTDSANAKEKDIALRMLFDEIVFAASPEEMDDAKREQRLREAAEIMKN